MRLRVEDDVENDEVQEDVEDDDGEEPLQCGHSLCGKMDLLGRPLSWRHVALRPRTPATGALWT